jgi:uncharacterized RDD family membrane protein YckC
MSQSQITTNFSKLGHYAGFISRLIAFIIDIVIITFVLSFTTWFLSVTITILQIKRILNWILTNLPGLKSIFNAISSPSALVLYAFLFIILYNIFFISITGQTPGKALMGVRVVPLRGGKISLWRAALRYLGYYISGAALGLGFLWILVDNRRMAWHDQIARTCVIYAWDARPDERFLVSAQERLDAERNSLNTFLARGETIARVLEDNQPNSADSPGGEVKK